MMKLPKTPGFRLDGKRALVTGASSGIGLGCAAALAEYGAHVVVAARSQDKLDAFVNAAQEDGLSAESCVMDVSDLQHMQAQLDQLDAFDILVNSAGIAKHGPALATEIDNFDKVIDVNLRGAYFLSQSIAKQMIAKGTGGSIINISSQMAHVGGIERSVYCASKFGVEGFTKAMAIEWGKHQVRINTVCPTFVRTALTQSTFDDPEKREWIMGKIKLGRVAEVEDIMGSVVFLASDAAAMITGTSLLVDGGWTAE
jgi:NAD(P)-dependent dehydrogenase (short-subunit alcohol dehydrogenase family)